ncbi:Nramp family divalent metal transporter [Clostridium folliculivorans]|uniref:Divalent metal cation transporter MntH n=1 Tax=Clostridium folliculivorans TaxID=2886038 RepID=A0A9W5Y557_9CLOT|nr:Nramp family divalent metal transporter [Clostridium folliculivorans]GKU26779.1 divalent metal cation transporter MntH [Clostridium folliculivorans]GKU31373.1 divalent metal cation transporter MntH [Clostridium folliculivorans]
MNKEYFIKNPSSIEATRPRINNFLIILKKLRGVLKFFGPAFIVSVAYIDPGNFATNISGGSIFNYNLLWVILWSNLMAIFLQIMSAKLGIATGKNLTEMCRDVFSKKANWFFFIISTLAAMATTMAEFIGGVLGLYLLFRIPLSYSVLLTAIITLLIAYLQKYGQRVVEIVITILVAIICVSYTIELFLAKPEWNQVAMHTLLPSIPNSQALLIAVGMLGATVMPHVIYLHSELVQSRNSETLGEKKTHLKMEKIDVFVAMNIAFIVNAAMVIVSASVFYSRGITVDSIEQAHRSLEPLLGTLSSGAFGAALLASGFSSSSVGAMAGETIMDGFVDVKMPAIIRRIITMLPGILVILIGVNPMKALLMSQVCLSFVLPVTIICMLIITSRKDLMGAFVNKPIVKYLGWLIAAVIIVLNAVLIYSLLI